MVNFFGHSHKKWKARLETQVVLLILSLELEISWGGRTEHPSKQRKKRNFCDELLSEIASFRFL